jgi:hypothetical protein
MWSFFINTYMISSFKNFYNKKENVLKPTKTSRKHTQSLNRNTVDRKALYFVPHSDRIKRSHPIITRFEANANLNVVPIDIKTAETLAKIFNRNMSKESGDFTKSLGRTDLFLIKRGQKYSIIRKK